MLNAVGLQNPGIEHVLAHELPELKRIYNKKIIANIGGFSVDEYVECARLAASADNVGMIELNISCPNVHGGGMGFGTTAESAGAVTKAVRAAVDQAPVRQVDAERDRHRGDRPRRRGGGARTASASSTPCWGCASTCGRKSRCCITSPAG